MVFGIKSKKCPCGTNHVSLDSIRTAVASFVSGAADPMNPRCCTLCFAGVIHDTAVVCDTVMDDIKEHQHPLFTSVFTLLGAFPRASVPHIRGCLDDAARRCPETHTYARSDQLCYEGFATRMLFFLFCALERGSRPIHRWFPAPAVGAHWPTDIRQLVPHGVDIAMDALVHWCCVLATSPPFSLLTTYVRVMPNVVLPALLAPARRGRLAWAMVTALSRRLHRVAWPDDAPPKLPAGVVRDTSECGSPLLAGWVMCAVYAMWGDSDRGAAELFQLVAGYERAFLGPVAALGASAHLLHPAAAGAVRPFADMLARLAAGTFESPIPGLPTSRLSWEYLNMADRTFGICAHAPCGAAEVSLAGVRKFARCGKCAVPRYCRRECQLADWRHGAGEGAVPHKKVCTTLLKLRDQIASRRNCNWATYMRIWDDCALDSADALPLRAYILASGLIAPVILRDDGY